MAVRIIVPDAEKDASTPNTIAAVVSPVIGVDAPRWYMGETMRSLLALIREGESGRAGYNADYRNDDRWTLTDKTFAQARTLGRQQVTKDKEASSAIGAYQFLTKTLDSLKASLKLTGAERFDAAFQDDLAVALMIRRGFLAYMRGVQDAETFANALAKEWASLPVVTAIQGASRKLKAGQSYYAGDGLNKALHAPGKVMEAVKALRALPMPPDRPAPAPEPSFTDPPFALPPDVEPVERALEGSKTGRLGITLAVIAALVVALGFGAVAVNTVRNAGMQKTILHEVLAP